MRKRTVKEAVGKLRIPHKQSAPVWAGPESDGPQGGVTQSLLGRYLVCKERFRLLVMDGLKPRDQFNSRLEFGSMWHVCEEWHAEGVQNWQDYLRNYASKLCDKYPFNRDEINNWYGICRRIFPLYVKYWQDHPDMQKRTPLMQEEKFKIPYHLPSGKTVYLRGKWDSVDLVDKKIILQENKTKSDPDAEQIQRQLTFDLQSMLYMIALQEWDNDNINQGVFAGEAAGVGFMVGRGAKISGIRYNVIKRPRQHQGKKETHDEFLERLKGIVKEKPDEFFMRWDVEISQQDIEKFKRECLNPVLENLCQDYEFWEYCKKLGQSPFSDDNIRFRRQFNHMPLHFRMPFGIYNVLAEGGSTDLDNYLATGSETGLVRTDNLFPELT